MDIISSMALTKGAEIVKVDFQNKFQSVVYYINVCILSFSFILMLIFAVINKDIFSTVLVIIVIIATLIALYFDYRSGYLNGIVLLNEKGFHIRLVIKDIF